MSEIIISARKYPIKFILSFALTLCFYALHGQQYQLNYLDELVPVQTSTESTAKVLLKTLNKAKADNNKKLIIKSLIASSSFNRINLDYNSAFDYAGEALFLSEESEDLVLMAKSHENFGVLNFLFRQNELALEHFTKSLKYYNNAFNKQLIRKSELYYPNYNLMLYYQRIKDSRQMTHYWEACNEILNTTNLNPIYKIYLDSEKAVNLMRAGHYNKSERLFTSCINTLKALKPGTKDYNRHYPFIVFLYNNMGRLNEKRGTVQNVGKYSKLAIENITMNGDQAFYISYVYSNYASWLFQQGDYYKAYIYLKNSKSINDNYQNARRRNNQGYLTIRDRYSEELQKKNEEISRQNLLLAENKQEILRTRILLFAILLLFVITAFVIRSRLQFLKHQKENEINRKKEQQAHELLEHKNRELTSTMLQLIEKEEILDSVAEHLKTNDDKTKTIKYLTSLRKQSLNLWDEFNSRFIEQNEGFYERLQEKVPGLSSNDLKICALIKLNFSGKEMATLLGISMGSVHVARHRLRKKMNLERDVNLTGFINSI